MKRTILSALLLAAFVCSCEKNGPSVIDPGEQDVPSDSTVVDSSLSAFECSFDSSVPSVPGPISLFCSDGKKFDLDSLIVGKDGAAVTYYGNIHDGEVIGAVSPSHRDASFWASQSTSEFTVRIPAVQTAVDGGADSQALVSVGEVEQSRVAFRTVGALIEFSVSEADIVSARLEAEAERDGALAGLSSVRMGSVLSVLVDRQDNSNSIVMNGELKAGGTYCFCVFPGLYVDARLVAVDAEGVEHIQEIGELELESGKRLHVADVNITGDDDPEEAPYVVLANEVFVEADGVEEESISAFMEHVDGWLVDIAFSGCVTDAWFDPEYSEIVYSVAGNDDPAEASGTIVLTLSKEGRDDLTFDITVIQEGREIVVPEGDESYSAVTSAPENWEGTYLVVSPRNMLAASGDVSSDNWLTAVSIAFDDNGNIARSEETKAVEMVVERCGNGYTVRFDNGNYLGSSDDNSGIRTAGQVSGDDVQYIWNFSFSGSEFNMYLPGVGNRSLRYNSRGFRAYSGTTGSSIVLYRYGGRTDISSSVTTSSTVSDKGETVALLKGSFKSESVPARLGFKYGTSSNALIYTAYADVPSSNAGEFSVRLENLTPGTLYYYQAFMVSGYVTYGGAVCSFLTEGKIQVDPSLKADYGWFELPAQTDLDRNGIDDINSDFYYSHTFRADAPRIRNFSCCYSKDKIHPVWVAAPMHSCYKGSSGRNDSYRADPNIHCVQNGKFTGYTRGHMLGSSDRTVSKETNRQVFFYSNIGAQLQTGFNTGGGAWNNLEDMVDGQWCSDTLYQVIGCIFESWTDRYGSTVTPRTASGSQIPTAYYKVLLRTKKGNTGKKVNECTADELKCAAFILRHSSNAGHKPSRQDLYTVEEVERLTGLTFFVNVPNAPKTSVNASDWGL